jgi:hypothetical protein
MWTIIFIVLAYLFGRYQKQIIAWWNTIAPSDKDKLGDN